MCLVMATASTPADTAAAQAPLCALTVDGVSAEAPGWRQAAEVPAGARLGFLAPARVAGTAEVRLSLPLGSVRRWSGEGTVVRVGAGVATVFAVDVDQLAGFNRGLHHLRFDAPGCQRDLWVNVDRGGFFVTGALGIAGLVTLVAGVALLVVRTTRTMGMARAFLAGAACGSGALLLSHQAGVVPLTLAWAGSWLVVPGVVAAGLQRLLVGGAPSPSSVVSPPPVRPPREEAGPWPGSSSPQAPPPVPSSAPRGAAGRGARSLDPSDVGRRWRRGSAAAPEPDPPRSSHARLECPDVVVAGTPFALVVGLAPEAVPGVVGAPLARPPGSTGAYELVVQLVADGFEVAGPARLALEVSAQAPYPHVEVSLSPHACAAPLAPRAIQALFSVAGQTIGFAVRPVIVAADVDQQRLANPPPPLEASVLGVPTDTDAPDLTIHVLRSQSGPDGRLSWTFESPHVPVPAEALHSDIGSAPEAFARKLVGGVGAAEAAGGLDAYLRGAGLTIADNMPAQVGSLLAEVAAAVSGRALRVFLLSDEPYVPWELAVLDPPLRADSAPFLGAQVEIGRWVLGQRRPALPAPTTVHVRSMAIVGGRYAAASARLPEAEAEAATLVGRYNAFEVNALAEDILGCLGGRPPADVVHFAVHGIYDAAALEEGVVLLDGTVLDPFHVKGARLEGAPFVFLNACQVGSSNELLGDYAGVAHAFLYAGAAGVVAPLWSISDSVARQLALEFYEQVLERGERPAAVLRSARARAGGEDSSGTATELSYRYFGNPNLRLIGER